MDELGELKDELESVHGINPCETSLAELSGLDLPKIDGLVRLFVHHLDLWEMECSKCKSYPDKKQQQVMDNCEFITRVLNLVEMLKPQKKEGVGHAGLKGRFQAA